MYIYTLKLGECMCVCMCVCKISRLKFLNCIVNGNYDWKFIAEIFNIIKNFSKMNKSWGQPHGNWRRKGYALYWESPFLLTLFRLGKNNPILPSEFFVVEFSFSLSVACSFSLVWVPAVMRTFFFFIQQVLISHQFYTHQCIHVNPNRPIHHTTLPRPTAFPLWCPYVCSLHLCLRFCPANCFIHIIFLGSTYMR